MSGEGRGFRREPFHHTAVAAERVNVRRKEFETGFVVTVGEPTVGGGHPDARRDPGAERAGRRFDARDAPVFRVSGATRAELTETFQVVERNRRFRRRIPGGVERFHSGEMERRVNQRRRVPDREDETVAARPIRAVRVELHSFVVKEISDRRERHRGARVPAFRRLNGVRRHRSHRVNRFFFRRRHRKHSSVLFPLRPVATGVEVDSKVPRLAYFNVYFNASSEFGKGRDASKRRFARKAGKFWPVNDVGAIWAKKRKWAI